MPSTARSSATAVTCRRRLGVDPVDHRLLRHPALPEGDVWSGVVPGVTRASRASRDAERSRAATRCAARNQLDEVPALGGTVLVLLLVGPAARAGCRRPCGGRPAGVARPRRARSSRGRSARRRPGGSATAASRSPSAAQLQVALGGRRCCARVAVTAVEPVRPGRVRRSWIRLSPDLGSSTGTTRARRQAAARRAGSGRSTASTAMQR